MAENRFRTILKASVTAILVNVMLGIFKAAVGMITRSIAITMDAINNFTDAGSSLITILSAHFAGKDADRKHPFGYGRTEYLGTLLIGCLILYAGITALTESVKSILHPEAAEYSMVTIGIVVVAVVVKIFLTLYIVRVGKSTKSDSLVASGKEAAGDVAISIATIIAALLWMFFQIPVEAWLGALIALVIIRSGVETLKETIGKILGTPAEASMVIEIKKTIAAHEQVKGAYDLILHNYGPDAWMASVHVAVEDTFPVSAFDDLTRLLQKEVLEKHNVFLSAVGLYSINTQDEKTMQIREQVQTIAKENPFVHQVHGFYLNEEMRTMRFDLVISFDAKDRREVFRQVLDKIQEKYPDFQVDAGLDTDYNECV